MIVILPCVSTGIDDNFCTRSYRQYGRFRSIVTSVTSKDCLASILHHLHADTFVFSACSIFGTQRYMSTCAQRRVPIYFHRIQGRISRPLCSRIIDRDISIQYQCGSVLYPESNIRQLGASHNTQVSGNFPNIIIRTAPPVFVFKLNRSTIRYDRSHIRILQCIQKFWLAIYMPGLFSINTL